MLDSFPLFTSCQNELVVYQPPKLTNIFFDNVIRNSLIVCILYIKNVKEAVAIHHLSNVFHLTSMLGKSVIIHLFFPLLLPTCVFHFRLDCLGDSFMGKLLYLDRIFLLLIFECRVEF